MHSRSRNAPIVVGFVVALLLLAAYPFSCGPAVYLAETGYISGDTVQTIYAPLGWLQRNSKVCRRVVDWYIDLWKPSR